MAFKLGNEVAHTQDEMLRLACRLMAGRCDGARTHDGVGFSRYDQAFGHKMADEPWHKWTARQKWAVYEMLLKYRNTQLEPIWHMIAPPPKPREVDRFEKQREAAKRHGRHAGMIRYAKVGGTDWFVIDVPWDKDLALRMQKIPGYHWNRDVKANLVPYAYDSIEPLLEFSGETGVEFDGYLLQKVLAQLEHVEGRLALSHAKESDFHIPDLPDGLELRPFQRAGIEYVVTHANGRGLIADEMGLGKTIQGLLTAKTLGAKRTVVVSPNTVKLNWQVETRKWWPGVPTTVLSGSPRAETVDLLKRVRVIDQHLRPYQDLYDAISLNDERRRTDLLMVYQRRWNRAVTQASLWNSSPELEDGWTPEVRDLAIERVRLAAKLVREGSHILLRDEWVCILNWDVLHAWVEALHAVGYDAVIGDEFHWAKNPAARRSQAMGQLLQAAKYRIALSGTPVANHPAEFGQVIKLLGYLDHFGGEKGYHKLYVLGEDPNRPAWQKKPKNEILEELNHKARARFMVRRTKAEVMPELPPVQHATVPFLLKGKWLDRYNEVEADVAAYFAEKAAQQRALTEEDERLAVAAGYARGTEAWQEFCAKRQRERYDAAYERAEAAKALLWWEALKQICVDAKWDQVCEWVDDFLANSEEKLVGFATHTHVLERLGDRYKAPIIYGGTSVEERQAAMVRFQQEAEPRCIFGNIKAMGEGVTLTRASNVVFFEFGWNPPQHDQPIGRCHRFGQKDSVTAWYLVAVRESGEPTVDQDVIELIAKKREVVDAITDGRGMESDISVLKELNARVAARAKAGKGHKEGPQIAAPAETAQYALAGA